MAEKSAKTVGLGTKPVPMKLFSAWEQEKTAPNCTPRLCTLTLTRLVVHKPLENDLNSVIIAVKMHNTKRVLRSNEIAVPCGSNLDTDLDLTFSLQYPHYLKRDGNKLQVMLQRRKKYRNKTILGYKTLAIGQVNMALVLQRSVDKELNLYSDHKENASLLATLVMLSLSSQPVDHVDNGQRKMASSDIDRSPDIDNESDDEDDQEEWSNEELSDSEAVMLDDDSRRRTRKSNLRQIRPTSTTARQQRNIKQKFIALLKRFKLTEEALDSEADHELGFPDTNPDPHDDIDDLIDELEDMSDSGPEMDTVSVVSTPKPRLRPFFQGRGSGAEFLETTKDNDKLSDDSGSVKKDSDSHADRDTDQDYSLSASPEIWTKPSVTLRQDKEKINRGRSRSYREKKNKKEEKHAIHRRHSAGPAQGSPRKVLLDQLSVVLGGAEDKLPDNVILINASEWQGQLMVQKLQEKNHFRIICTCGDADVKAAVSGLVSKLQKYCNSNSKAPVPIKVAIAGGDDFINSVLRPYVDQFSAKSPDWQSYVRFLVIPFGNSSIGKYLGTLDSTYGSLFLDPLWKDTFEKPEMSKLDSQEIINRVSKYLGSASGVVQIPVAEAMVMCKGKSGEEESTQIFIPFISEVKIGSQDVMNASMDFDEPGSLVNSPSLSSSPPAAMQLLDKPKSDLSTPPNSPNVSTTQSAMPLSASSSTPSASVEFMELQVDYWTATNKPDISEKADKASKKDSNKCTLKTTFKSLLVHRLAQPGTVAEVQSAVFSMLVVTREKKQKIMRIGKKAKEAESKSQVVEGINRLTCSTKSQNYSLKVWVDGVEWSSVKFFQLSSQWQTHIKHFPVVVFGNIEPI